MKIRCYVARGALLLIFMARWSAMLTAQDKNKFLEGEAPIAVVNGKAISRADIDKLIEHRLVAVQIEEYDLKRHALNDVIDQRLLAAEAARRGIGLDELTRLEIEEKIRPAAENEVKAVYEATKDRYGEIGAPEIVRQIESNLRQGRIKLQRDVFLKELRKKADIQILLDPPRMKVSADDTRAKGAKDAPVTIVEFAEFQCPYCARMVPVLKEIEDKYKGRVRIVFRDFPVHQDALKAAEAASCAHDQGRFWEMHDKLFANQSSLKVADLKRYASDVGLKMEPFNQCLDSGKYGRRVQDDSAEGTGYGITGTPSFFINGRILVGAAPLEDFAQIIDEELKRGRSNSSANGHFSASYEVVP